VAKAKRLTPVRPAVLLKLTDAEALALFHLTSHVGGGSDTARAEIEAIRSALKYQAGVRPLSQTPFSGVVTGERKAGA
jgi:hypothetical protein